MTTCLLRPIFCILGRSQSIYLDFISKMSFALFLGWNRNCWIGDYGDVLCINASTQILFVLDSVYRGALRSITNCGALTYHLYTKVKWPRLHACQLGHWNVFHLQYKAFLLFERKVCLESSCCSGFMSLSSLCPVQFRTMCAPSFTHCLNEQCVHQWTIQWGSTAPCSYWCSASYVSSLFDSIFSLSAFFILLLTSGCTVHGSV